MLKPFFPSRSHFGCTETKCILNKVNGNIIVQDIYITDKQTHTSCWRRTCDPTCRGSVVLFLFVHIKPKAEWQRFHLSNLYYVAMVACECAAWTCLSCFLLGDVARSSISFFNFHHIFGFAVKVLLKNSHQHCTLLFCTYVNIRYLLWRSCELNRELVQY